MLKKLLASKAAQWLIMLVGLLGYSFQLTRLPVFADEAIYIRWSQLIIDDWQRYLFFPLNDGKTPLFMWLMVPGQLWGHDALFAARFVSLVSALVLVYLVGKIVREMSGSKRASLISQALMVMLPFWFFSARLALIDTVLVALIAASLLNFLEFFKQRQWWKLVLSGLWLGLAFWTKLPTILCLPLIAIIVATTLVSDRFQLPDKEGKKQFLITLVVVFGIGIGLFGLLKLQSAFGQLFSRGGDFLYPLRELSLYRLWFNLTRHTADFTGVFFTYLTGSGLFLMLTAIIIPTHRRRILGLILAAIVYCLPIIILGKVIYPRYLLPAALPLTLAIALAIDSYLLVIYRQANLRWRTILSLFLALSLAHMISFSTAFWLYGWLNPNRLPLTSADKVQYLREWSAGNGLKETADDVIKVAETQRILVLTEGYFGTLPDGLLLYLHGKNVTNIFVEGIGQPVRQIPVAQIENAKKYDVVWLVVNSHRLMLNPPPDKLVARYCRLTDDPCLEVWDITHYQNQ